MVGKEAASPVSRASNALLFDKELWSDQLGTIVTHDKSLCACKKAAVQQSNNVSHSIKFVTNDGGQHSECVWSCLEHRRD